ncbi:hypothetical protein SLA2020_143470 [Shorea laevis]
MEISVYLLVFTFLQIFLLSPCTASDTLREGDSLHVQKPGDVLASKNGVFNAGFYKVGENAFCFAIWFNVSSDPDPNHTVVWMANRDQPVNSKGSKVSLLRNGGLILTDTGGKTEWNVDSVSAHSVQLKLLNNGNLVLQTLDGKSTLWESFKFPTDTILPNQEFTKDTNLISSRSRSNYSSGNYKFYFDNDNILRLLYQVSDITSVYWPPEYLRPWEVGSERSTYNSSRVAMLNSSGNFWSSDSLWFQAVDSGAGTLRRLTLDPDGNLRLYSLEETAGTWNVSWEAFGEPCKIHGICGRNSLCKYDRIRATTCSCLPGFKIKNSQDWSQGCVPEFKDSCNQSDVGFVKLTHVEFYGFDKVYNDNSTLKSCEENCLKSCECEGFQFKYDRTCYTKTLLINGYRSPAFGGDFYLKLPKSSIKSGENLYDESRLACVDNPEVVTLNRTYSKGKQNGSLKFLVWFSSGVGVVEFIFIFLVWCILFRSNEDDKPTAPGYTQVATGFRRYTYSELKKATNGFSEEIGRGGAGIVYKGELPDHRVAAIKSLHEAGQGEAEFLTEVSTISGLNHMNLIEMWGYCVEGKHRLLVYEYMEHGSLADNLSKNALNWAKRFEIAVSTAKGLAYLHEECLDWILHCDIKPQNILLDSNFQPKVADFGLSKLLNRGGLNSSGFSRIRGTRGYMAPEWVYNLPITSKVDVYSYGIVVLEMVTGKSLTGAQTVDNVDQVVEQWRLVPWVREKVNRDVSRNTWIEEVADPMLASDYDLDKMERLVEVALQCVEEEMDARPTMRQVVEMLSDNEDGTSNFV